MHLAIASVSLSLLGIAGTAGAATIFVAPDGSGDYPTIQAAINASVSGDTVLLGDGVFTGPDNRDLIFSGRDITLASASGDPTQCIIDAEHQDHVLTFFSERPGLVIENITLLNGWAPDDGGNVFAVNLASPTIRGCIIAGGKAGRGGGIFARGTGSPRIEGCWILDNEALDGGGVYAIEGSEIVLDDCVVAGNRSTGLGGAGVWLGAASAPSIAGTTIALNEALGPGVGGGLFVHAQTTVVLDRSILWGNVATAGADVHFWDLSCEIVAGCSVVRAAGIGGLDELTAVGELIDEDPGFCLTATTFGEVTPDAFALEDTSPCLPANNGCGVLIGARPDCGGITPVDRTSWGGIKSRF
jgi:hypothetical protein